MGRATGDDVAARLRTAALQAAVDTMTAGCPEGEAPQILDVLEMTSIYEDWLSGSREEGDVVALLERARMFDTDHPGPPEARP